MAYWLRQLLRQFPSLLRRLNFISLLRVERMQALLLRQSLLVPLPRRGALERNFSMPLRLLQFFLLMLMLLGLLMLLMHLLLLLKLFLAIFIWCSLMLSVLRGCPLLLRLRLLQFLLLRLLLLWWMLGLLLIPQVFELFFPLLLLLHSFQ